MKPIRLFFIPLLLLFGCSTLQPIDLPAESALTPVDAPLWTALEAERSEDWFALLNQGSLALEWRLRMMDSATKSLDLQTFLWKEDPTGLALFKRILRTADRGVHVRLLLDDSFIINENDLLFDLTQHPQIELRIYNPFKRRSDSMMKRQFLNLGEFSRVDHRMHNKVMIVDNRAMILGGRNLADEYFGNHEAGNFRDMEILSAGKIVQKVSHTFDSFWNNPWSFPADRVLSRPSVEKELPSLRTWLDKTLEPEWNETLDARHQHWRAAAQNAAPGEAVLLADDPAPENPADAEERPDQLAQKLIGWIDQAVEELILVTAYLIPTPELEAAVARAEKRGVHVRILTNSLRSNNHTSAHSVYRRHVRHLVDHGADLHEVRAHAKDRSNYMRIPVEDKKLGLHAKLLLIDREHTFVGSANLDPRSLRLNTEIGLMIQSPDLNQRLRDLLEIDFNKRNAWHLKVSDSGDMTWVADDMQLDSQPADSLFQRLEDWFLSTLPIEGEM